MSRSSGYRLPAGGVIDRSRTLKFVFEGKPLTGHPGDTLASALIANRVSLVARSFKYHRPRGFFGVGLEEPSAMFAVADAYGFDPAIRGGQIPLVDGMQVRTISGSPSPAFDLAAVAQLAAPILAAGFYYKTFKWPRWDFFDPIIRRATGWGRPLADADRRVSLQHHDSCDVLIIGAGPAGLGVARALHGSGLRVIVAEAHHTLGGSLLWETASIDGQSAITFCRRVISELQADSEISILPRTLVSGAYENNVFTLVQSLGDASGTQAERHWKLRARFVVLATGMIDRPLLFEGNDRPGVMLSSAVRRLIGEFATAPAARLAVCTNNDSAYLTAMDASRSGIEVKAIVDTRPEAAAKYAGAARRLGIEVFPDTEVVGTRGYRRLESIVIRDGTGKRHKIECDGLASSGGWTPMIGLAGHRGFRPAYDPGRSLFVCRDLPPGWIAAGGSSGALDLRAALDEAAKAATTIAAAAGVSLDPEFANILSNVPVDALDFGSVTPAWLPRQGSTSKIWVDLQNDVTASDILLAARENYASVEHLKRYTTLGMGTDQGRTSNVNGLAILSSVTGRDIAELGTTTSRPPTAGVRFGTIAASRTGDLYRPRRYLPAAQVHREFGAEFVDFGWERPDWYRSNGSHREAAVLSEMQAVRSHVGVFDCSSLGKIEISGPDAREFISKFYVSSLSTLKPGSIRYSVMLRDDGVIFDDGVVMCLSDTLFLANTTTSNADKVAAHFERWRQTEWPSLKVAISPITEQWATFAIAGPEARTLLNRLVPDFDTSASAFRHMQFRHGMIKGMRARVARVSYTGELQYEVSVPATRATDLLRAMSASVTGLAPRPVGMEAWLRLRLEKGYIHVGSDTNGRTTPLDIGMASIVARRTDDFIGRRSLALPSSMSPDRESLVGLVADAGTLRAGGRILADGNAGAPGRTDGYVTSACFSPALGHPIGLALLERGTERLGEAIRVFDDGNFIRCRVCKPLFYDTANERLHG